jgi:hypothetical protein
VLVGACRRGAPSPVAAGPTLEQVVLARFDAWDLDGDNVLEAAEIDQLVVDPSHEGGEAAALAAMKLAMRSGRITPAAPPPLALRTDRPARLQSGRRRQGGPRAGSPDRS